MLLASFGARRPTVDADALARNMASDQETVARCVAEIATIEDPDDGVEFLPETVTTAVIRDDALTATAGFRGTTLIPLAQAAEGLAVLRNSTYAAYRTALGEAGASLPERFSDTVAAVAVFVDPVLGGLDAEAVWSPAGRSWSATPVTPSGSTETATGRTDL